MSTCSKKYDVIVFATLDSHAAFSSLSSLRMDNYVFTEESLKQATKLLSPDGVIYMRFVIPDQWLWERHAKALEMATNCTPVGFQEFCDMRYGTLVAGPGLSAAHLPPVLQTVHALPVKLNSSVPLSTDDWPFLFLPKRELPSSYLLPILAIFAISCIPVMNELKRGRKEVLNWQMFMLGMAFMLLEVKVMANLALLFGFYWDSE